MALNAQSLSVKIWQGSISSWTATRIRLMTMEQLAGLCQLTLSGRGIYTMSLLI
jgi:hypothetical protein